MKALQVNAAWKPREGYNPSAREERDKRADRGFQLFYEPSLELIEKPIPQPKDDEVLLKVGGAGVCGSDTNFLGKSEDGYTKYAGHCLFPCVIGHEFSGEVAAVGKNVKNFKPGDLVTAETMNWCGECTPCKMGMFNQCENLEEIGFTLDGGFAEYLVAKEKFCFSVNEFLNIYENKQRALEVAALIEPTAVAYNGLITRGGSFNAGAYVAVYGCGPVGLAAIALARVSGASKVIAFDLADSRLELAKKVGADVTYNPVALAKEGKTSADAVMYETKGLGAHVQVEATESQGKTIPEIEKVIAVGGKVIQIGVTSLKTTITSIFFQKKGASYYGSNGSAGHDIWPSVIRLMASGRIDMSRIIHKCYPLDQAVEAIQDAKNGTPGKNIITPNW